MNIFIYGDESGVFDKKHQKFFVFGGVIFLDKNQRDKESRKYASAEKLIAENYKLSDGSIPELKASLLKNKHKSGLFRSMNGLCRYAFIVKQEKVLDRIFENRKSKQRFLDYVYKVGIKRCFNKLIDENVLKPDAVENIYVFLDEHTTATDGKYELQEGMLQEYKIGTFSYDYNCYHEPIFPNMSGTVSVRFFDSRKNPLIRASDIIANQAWYHASTNKIDELKLKVHTFIFP